MIDKFHNNFTIIYSQMGLEYHTIIYSQMGLEYHSAFMNYLSIYSCKYVGKRL